MTDWLKVKWCSLFHGGGTILRDCYGRINWKCVSCGRWSTPVDKQTEKLWIENWSPEFTYDPDWSIDEDKAQAAIAKAEVTK